MSNYSKLSDYNFEQINYSKKQQFMHQSHFEEIVIVMINTFIESDFVQQSIDSTTQVNEGIRCQKDWIDRIEL